MTQTAVAAVQFVRIPLHIVQADISKTALKVFIALSADVTSKKCQVLVNCKELAETLGRSAATIRRAVRELVQYGFLEWTKEWFNRATRVFRLVVDAVKSVGAKCRVLPSEARRTDNEQHVDSRSASPEDSAAAYMSASNNSVIDEVPGQAREDGNVQAFSRPTNSDSYSEENPPPARPSSFPGSRVLVPEVYSDRKTYPHFKVDPEEEPEIQRIGQAMMRLGLEMSSTIRLITKYSYQRCDLELKRIAYIIRLGTDVTVTEEYFDRALQCRVDMEKN